MMVVIIVNFNVNNYVHYVNKEYVKNVILLDGLLKKINVYHYVVMVYYMDLNYVMI